MKKVLILLLVLVLAVVLVVAGLVFWTISHVNSPAFAQQLSQQVSEKIGAEVSLQRLNYKFPASVSIQGFAIPHEEDGNLIALERLDVEVKILPMFSNRLEIANLHIHSVDVLVKLSEEGGLLLPFELPEETAVEDEAMQPDQPQQPVEWPDIIVEKFVFGPAALLVLDAEKNAMLRVKDFNLSGDLAHLDGRNQGSLTARAASIFAMPGIGLTDVQTPVVIEHERIVLEPIKSLLHGGTVSGKVALLTGDSLKYDADIQLEGVALPPLMEAMGRDKDMILGHARGTFKGSGNLEQPLDVVGSGNLVISEPELPRLRQLALVGNLLGVPSLRDGKFDQIDVDYTISNQVLSIHRLTAESSNLTVVMDGTVGFDQTLNLKGTIQLAAGTLATAAGGLGDVGAQITGLLGLGRRAQESVTRSADQAADKAASVAERRGIPFTVTGTSESPVIRVQGVELGKDMTSGGMNSLMNVLGVQPKQDGQNVDAQDAQTTVDMMIEEDLVVPAETMQ